MAIVVKDRVKVTSTTTGTSDFTLGSTALGFQSFAAIGNNNQTYYAAVDPITGDWEVGYGTYTTAGPTLTRTTILSSSAAGAKVSFSAGSKDVFCTYPSEKAIYEEASGNVLIDGGPITVIGSGVTSYTSLAAALGELYANINSYAQLYAQNQSAGADASTDIVAYNDLTVDGSTNFTDMGIASSNYTAAAFPIFPPGSGYVYHDGDDFLVGNQTAGKDLIFFTGGVQLTNEAIRIKGADQSVELASDLTVAGTLSVTGAADFGSTVLLAANPTTALQAATKQYVDNQVTAGLHIHDPVRVETTGNLTATYTQGGTTFDITDITGNKTLTTSVNHGLSLNDQIWLYSTAGNGLSINTAYFVFSTPALNQITVSLTFNGAEVTGLTNATGLTYNTRANSGVGAKLTNSGTQAALVIDNVTMASTNRVMVRLQTNGEENGVYTVTNIGSGATNWELTRATDSNKVNPADPNGVGTGDYYFTREGTLNAGDSHVLTTEPNTMILGYTALTYTQFSGGVVYTGTAPINVTGQVISLTGTVAATNGGTGTATVTTGDLLYGSATNTWSKLPLGAGYKSLIVNAGGTQVEWNAVALNQSAAVSGSLGPVNGGTGQSGYTLGDTLYSSATDTLAKLAGNTTTTKKFLGQTGTGAASAAPSWQQPAATDITGLAASATTDTTNAANITSGTLPSGRISGSYTGLTGTGALAAGSLASGFTAVSAPLGGTGQTSYAVGDLLYASTSTALSKLADVAVGNALISGGVGSAPSYGKIGAATHISGTLPTANGGTGLTGFTANGVVYASSTSALATNAALTFNGTVLNNTAGEVSAVGFNSNAVGGEGGQISLQNPTNTGVVYTFDVVNSTTGRIFTTTNNSILNIGQLGGTGGQVVFTTEAVERMRIASSGNVGIGTVSPTATLEVVSASSTNALRITQTGTGNALLVEDAANPDATPFVIDAVGSVITGHTQSQTIAGAAYQYQMNGSNPFSAIRWNSSNSLGLTALLGRSRSGTVGVNSIVAANDVLGTLTWAGDDGTAFVQAASISAAVDGTPGTNDMPGRLVFSTTADGAASPTERMRINSAGEVGFGTTSLTGMRVAVGGSLTGATIAVGLRSVASAASDVTTAAIGIQSRTGTATAAFTLPTLEQFRAGQPTLGAGSAVTNQYGFHASSELIGATNNYGFYGGIASGTGRYNFYAAGTANNYFAGNVGIGTTTPQYKLDNTGVSRLGSAVTAVAPSATDILPTAHTILSGAGGNYLTFGQYPAGQGFAQWIQSSFTNPTTAVYNLVLNPLGGNVGIGTNSPSTALQVNGTVTATTFAGAGTSLTGTASGLSIGGNAATATTANALNTANSYTVAAITASTGTGKVAIATDAGGSISMGRTDGVASTPFLDFNSGATAVDYDVRMMASGGNGTSGNGTLTVTGTLAATTFSGAGTSLTGTAASLSIGGTAANVTGTVAIANGGTGQTTRQEAMDALAGATTSGQYLRGNGTDVVMAAIVAADVPTLNQNTTGSAATLTTGRTIAITGDLTYTSGSFNGSANVTGTGTLANSGVTAGSYTVSSITVDAKGRVTAASSGSAPAPTTAQVLSATAGAAAGDVGSYAFLARVAGKASSGAGTTIAGSNLRYSNAYSNNDQANEGSNSVAPAGTWMIMGNTGFLNLGTGNTNDGFMMTLFLRIS